MIRKVGLVLICFLLISFGCENKNDKLNSFIAETFPDLINGQILVIPNSGCTSCISDAENSVDSLVEKKNYKIIFSQVQSLKVLNYRLRKLDIDVMNSNIFIDTANQYTRNSESYNELWAFPTVITVKDRIVANISRQ